jgi:leucyl aminopeptidase
VPLLAQERDATLRADGLTARRRRGSPWAPSLRAWRFDRYRTQEKPEDKPKLARLVIGTAEGAAAKAAWAGLRPVAEGVFLGPRAGVGAGQHPHPAEMAERLPGAGEARRPGGGAGAEGDAEAQLRRAAGRGAGQRQRGADGGDALERHGRQEAGKPVCFIGKGVTFDTGGVSIKPAAGMEDMKWDMAGAGAVIGAMAALAGRKARADVVGIVGLVENMVSHNAQRPGDVVTTASGQTVEVINTDAEGRLVLADVIHYAIERFDPTFMVDLATLTGAIIVALGHEHAGLFSNDDALAERLQAAGVATGELAWRLPLATPTTRR